MSNLRKLSDFTQLDLFTPDFSDISTRMLQDMMWRPFFALGKKPRHKPIEYKTDNVSVKIVGSGYGLATIWDADILMWIISQIVERLDKGEQPSPQVHFTPYECLQAIRRGTGGSQYLQVINALQRLHGTIVETTIRKPDQVSLTKSEVRRLKAGFHLLEAYGVQYTEDRGKEQVKGITVVLSNWLYKGVINRRNVLTINDDYFLLKGGLERVLYLLARKHTGKQKHYSASMRELYEKTGSEQPFHTFCRAVRKCVELNRLPEYFMMLSPKGCRTHCPGHSTELIEAHWNQEVITFWNQEYLILKPLQLKSF